MYTLGITKDPWFDNAPGEKLAAPKGGWAKWSWAHNQDWLDSGIAAGETFQIATPFALYYSQLQEKTRRRRLGAELLYLHLCGYEAHFDETSEITPSSDPKWALLSQTGNNTASADTLRAFRQAAMHLDPPANSYDAFWTASNNAALSQILTHLGRLRASSVSRNG